MVGIEVYSPEQAFLITRFQKVTSLYSFLDTCLRSGNPQEITKDSNNQLLRDQNDKPFSLLYDATGVWGVNRIRSGMRKSMEGQGLGLLAEEIIASYNESPTDRNLREHIAATGGY